MLSILTPTVRPQFFPLLEKCLARQTYTGPVQWVVVGKDVSQHTFRAGQEVYQRDTSNDDPRIHDLCHNVVYGLERCRGDAVVVVEDDDPTYREDYLECMSHWLDSWPLVGSCPAFYYSLVAKTYRCLNNYHHASLAQTGWTREVFPVVKRLAKNPYLGTASPFLDMRLWPHWRNTLGKKSLLVKNDFEKPWLVGVKDGTGIGLGHQSHPRDAQDPDGRQFRAWGLDKIGLPALS